jgi:hypothetical protein
MIAQRVIAKSDPEIKENASQRRGPSGMGPKNKPKKKPGPRKRARGFKKREK